MMKEIAIIMNKMKICKPVFYNRNFVNSMINHLKNQFNLMQNKKFLMKLSLKEDKINCYLSCQIITRFQIMQKI